MNFNRFDSNNSDNNPNSRSTNSGINFDFPSINLNLNTITEALNPRNFNLVSNIEDLMSSTKCGNRVKDTSCQSCGTKFTIFPLKRKKTCFDCNMDFCNQCLNKDVGYDRNNHCKRCIVFNSRPLDRNALNGLRPRDLKWFLASKRVPSQMCNEKRELIDLILQTFSPQTTQPNSDENNRRFDNYSNTARNESPDIQNQTRSQSATVDPNESPTVETTDTASNISINQNNCDSNQLNERQSETENKQNIYFNVDDIQDIQQLKELSVKQLKLILTRNFIDYKGCVEKEELLSKAKRLWTDRHHNRHQNADEIPDQNVCKICFEATIDCVLLECGHMISCTNCGKRLNECPICRQYVVRVVHTFKS